MLLSLFWSSEYALRKPRTTENENDVSLCVSSLDLFFEAGLCTFTAVSLESNVEAAAQSGNWVHAYFIRSMNAEHVTIMTSDSF